MSEADGMREKIAQAVQDHFSDGGGCVGGHDWSWDREEAARQSTAAADAVLRLVSLSVPDDVAALVIAARNVAFDEPDQASLRALDIASEAFADRVPWEDEPEAAPPSTQEASQ